MTSNRMLLAIVLAIGTTATAGEWVNLYDGENGCDKAAGIVLSGDVYVAGSCKQAAGRKTRRRCPRSPALTAGA